MTANLRSLLENFPREWTVGQILDELKRETKNIELCDERCGHRNCKRLLFWSNNRWLHIAPDGKTSVGCRSASFNDPKPGDEEEKAEWLNWPTALERQKAKHSRT